MKTKSLLGFGIPALVIGALICVWLVRTTNRRRFVASARRVLVDTREVVTKRRVQVGELASLIKGIKETPTLYLRRENAPLKYPILFIDIQPLPSTLTLAWVRTDWKQWPLKGIGREVGVYSREVELHPKDLNIPDSSLNDYLCFEQFGWRHPGRWIYYFSPSQDISCYLIELVPTGNIVYSLEDIFNWDLNNVGSVVFKQAVNKRVAGHYDNGTEAIDYDMEFVVVRLDDKTSYGVAGVREMKAPSEFFLPARTIYDADSEPAPKENSKSYTYPELIKWIVKLTPEGNDLVPNEKHN